MEDKDQINQDLSVSRQGRQSLPQLHKDSLKIKCTSWCYSFFWANPQAYPHCTAIWPGELLQSQASVLPLRSQWMSQPKNQAAKKMSSPHNIPSSWHLIISFSGYWQKSHMAFSLWNLSFCFLLTQFCFPFSADQNFSKGHNWVFDLQYQSCSNNNSSNHLLYSPWNTDIST